MDTVADLLRLITLLAAFAVGVFAGHRHLIGTTDWPCGGNLTGTEGTIASPNYPNNYPSSANCVWTVTSLYYTKITINIESFRTEDGHDYLDIRDGHSSSAPSLAHLTGSSISINEVFSTGSHIRFHFISDNSFEYSGFKLNWLAAKNCYYCDNSPDSNQYDPACGEDNYDGHEDLSFKSMACYTNVHYDGSHRVERGWTENTEEDGTCYDSGFSFTCYCKGVQCNNDLCQNCITTTPSLTTTTIHPFITSTPPPSTITVQPSITTTPPPTTYTQPPATTTLPSSSSQPPTPAGPLQCYSCINCNIVSDDTNIQSSEEFLSCFVSIEIGNAHFVIRGGSRDYHEDGACFHEADGAIVCFCSSNLCNNDAATELIP